MQLASIIGEDKCRKYRRRTNAETLPSKRDLTSFAARTNLDVQALSEEQLSIGKDSQLDGGLLACVPFQIALEHVKKKTMALDTWLKI